MLADKPESAPTADVPVSDELSDAVVSTALIDMLNGNWCACCGANAQICPWDKGSIPCSSIVAKHIARAQRAVDPLAEVGRLAEEVLHSGGKWSMGYWPDSGLWYVAGPKGAGKYFECGTLLEALQAAAEGMGGVK
jgi:hypothetical protein